MRSGLHPWLVVAALAVALLAGTHAHAEVSATEPAKLAQSPVGNLISLPFRNNTHLNFGPGPDGRYEMTRATLLAVSVPAFNTRKEAALSSRAQQSSRLWDWGSLIDIPPFGGATACHPATMRAPHFS